MFYESPGYRLQTVYAARGVTCFQFAAWTWQLIGMSAKDLAPSVLADEAGGGRGCREMLLLGRGVGRSRASQAHLCALFRTLRCGKFLVAGSVQEPGRGRGVGKDRAIFTASLSELITFLRLSRGFRSID